ncbi:N-acylneuraminate cytidylyltransferase [Chryseolinea serpens]|uniref:N-acylneuraminate cytidylyltransferase n=1 Tax=Chryseolinea serpens TaxID=947013 RepID=A0A1M5KYD6_9BACT|nr:acylneuraminate cytidylyltransferase family protein [Chryseolinea serpens]SHG57777.1 N-acylneuraminate cytidylyltransferase [Chryseolinea serpens]
MNEILVVIPARGGSKGILRKNVRLLGGKPLIHYSIEIAKALFPEEHICVSTDDAEIKEVSEKMGIKVPFIRPEELATDTASTQDVILHALDFYANRYLRQYKGVLLLQPTSPFRRVEQVQQAIDLFRSELDMVASVKRTKSNPYFNLFEMNRKDGLIYKSKTGNFTRRQDSPTIYELNGSIYVMNVSALRKGPIGQFERIAPYEMGEEYSVDLDEEKDWQWAEWILKTKGDYIL